MENVLNFGNKGYGKALVQFDTDEVSLAPHFSEVLMRAKPNQYLPESNEDK